MIASRAILVMYVMLISLDSLSAQQQRTQQRSNSPSTQQRAIKPGAGQAQTRVPQIRRINPASTSSPRMPKGFPLDAQAQKRVDDVLAFWQQTTANIKTFECRFRKWDYDGVFGVKQNGKLLPKSESDGILRYSRPDKGLYQVTEVRDLVPPKGDEKPQFKKREGVAGERWVCDGATVYEFDFRQKQLVETVLPPSMRGQAITSGPLPFMFGARSEEIKQRYWIRELTPPPTVQNQFWLEAFPKRREDAANFERIIVFLDREKFLPIAMRVYERNGKSYAAYSFSNRKTNGLANFDTIFRKFIPKDLPGGWQRVKRDFADALPQQAAKQDPRQNAQLQKNSPVRTAQRTEPKTANQRPATPRKNVPR